MSYKTVRTERHGRAGVVTLHRPEALNALNILLINELEAALAGFESDDGIGCVVLTGSLKAFCAGYDLEEMAAETFSEAYLSDLLSRLDCVARMRKPIIAAVSGFALGAGCELAMMCDFILAADNAMFAQPEIEFGVIPAGGAQYLTRAVGKAKAMEMCLTGRAIDAEEAERVGLVSRIVSVDDLVPEALAVAQAIAATPQPAVLMAKEAVKRAYETTLAEGVRQERDLFCSLFATQERKQGMAAFLEKRQARFKNQ